MCEYCEGPTETRKTRAGEIIESFRTWTDWDGNGGRVVSGLMSFSDDETDEKTWSMAVASDRGDVISGGICFCPMCGRELDY